MQLRVELKFTPSHLTSTPPLSMHFRAPEIFGQNSSAKLWLVRSICITLLMLSPMLLKAQSIETGVVRGRVFNSLSGSYVANARISIEGTKHETTSDESGTFQLSEVLAGESKVHVSYLGLPSVTKTVQIAKGETTELDFVLSRAETLEAKSENEVVKLQKITVVADRELSAQAIAMNEQRSAPNLKNVVAIDEYPVDGNGNIGEFLKYIPGVAVSFSGFQPVDVSVRGMPGNVTPIMIDGGLVPSVAGGDTRGGSMTGIPMTNVSRIEVTKVPTPDLPAESLGGSINIISRSSFERTKAQFTYNAYTTFNAELGLSLKKQPAPINNLRTSSIGPSLNLSYIMPINKSLAINFGGSYIYSYIPSDQTGPVWNLDTLVQTSTIFQSTPQLATLRNLNFGADWKLGSQNVFAVTFQQRRRDAEATTSGLSIAYGAGATGGPTFTQGAATGVGSISQIPTWLQTNNVLSIVTFRHKFTGRDWKIETNASFAKGDTERFNPGYFQTAALARSNLVIRGDNIEGSGKSMESIIPTSFTIRDRNGNPVSVFDGNQLSITTASDNELYWNRSTKQWKTVLTRDFDTHIPFSVKVGFEINSEDYSQSGGARSFTFRSGTTDDVRLAGNYPGLIDAEFSNSRPPFAGGQVQFINLTKLYDLYEAHPEYFLLNESAAHTSEANVYRTLTETVSAGFIRFDLKFFTGRLWLVGGVRYEQNALKGVGPLNDPSAWLQKDANGNLVRTSTGATIPLTNDALERIKLQWTKGGSRAERNYDDYYPSLNASYAISEKLFARFGYARTTGRPNRTSIIPGVTFSAPTTNPAATQTITVNNTGLMPWTGNNYDFTLESYLYKGGVGSIGVFRKDITGFFVASNVDATPEILELYGLTAPGLNYDIISRANSTDPTRIDGFEFNYKQSLTFLPTWARGVQVFLNYTKLSLSGANNADFTGFNPETYSYGVNLTRPRYSVKFLMQVQGETRRAPVAANAATGIPADTFLWQGAKKRPTITAEYRLRKNLSVYGSVSDFVDSFQDVQRRYPDGGTTPEYAKYQRLQEWGWAATFGVKGEF